MKLLLQASQYDFITVCDHDWPALKNRNGKKKQCTGGTNKRYRRLIDGINIMYGKDPNFCLTVA